MGLTTRDISTPIAVLHAALALHARKIEDLECNIKLGLWEQW